MIQVSISEAKTELSRLVESLETHQEDVIYIAKNGKPIVKMTLIMENPQKQRIGAAKGKLKVPREFDCWDSEIEEMFEDK